MVVLGPALLNGLNLANNVQRESARENVSLIFCNVMIDLYGSSLCGNACCTSYSQTVCF